MSAAAAIARSTSGRRSRRSTAQSPISLSSPVTSQTTGIPTSTRAPRRNFPRWPVAKSSACPETMTRGTSATSSSRTRSAPAIRASDSSAAARTCRSLPSTLRSRISTRAKSDASTTVGSRKASPARPTSVSSSAITISSPSRGPGGRETRSSTPGTCSRSCASRASILSFRDTGTSRTCGRSPACCSSTPAPSRRCGRAVSPIRRTTSSRWRTVGSWWSFASPAASGRAWGATRATGRRSSPPETPIRSCGRRAASRSPTTPNQRRPRPERGSARRAVRYHRDCGPPRVAGEEAARNVLRLDPAAGKAAADGGDVVLAGQLDRPALEAGGVLGRRPDANASPDIDAEMVVVAAGGEECGGAHVHLLLEAERIAVERERLVDVADVEMQVADTQAYGDLRRRRLVGDGGEERVDIEGSRAAPRELLAEVRPPITWTVGSELDPVPVGVGQVDRLMRAVVGHPLDRRPRHDEPPRRPGELSAARVEERVVVEAGVAAGRPRLRILVEGDDRVGTVAELGLAVVPAMYAQAERRLVPRNGAVEARDRQLHPPEPNRGGEPGGGRGVGGGLPAYVFPEG